MADHIDLKDHYIAFIELKSFGIDEDLQKTMGTTKNEDISVKMLKDTVQVALVQQSEYLRRFGLVFCESVRYNSNITSIRVIAIFSIYPLVTKHDFFRKIYFSRSLSVPLLIFICNI